MRPFQDSGFDPYSTALFFDFDGTLVDIAEHPDSVTLTAPAAHALAALSEAVDGAVAIVSGRPIRDIDRYLGPYIPDIPIAGVHGLEFRNGVGVVDRFPFDERAFASLTAKVRDLAGRHDDLVVEAKQGSLALHYRQRPDLEAVVRSSASTLASETPGVDLVLGKMVVELRLGGRNKGDAIARFMGEQAFRGRTPWFFGDDATDEDGFRFVNGAGGRSFRIGDGPTMAKESFDDFDAFQRWLVTLADGFRPGTTFKGGNTTGIGSMR